MTLLRRLGAGSVTAAGLVGLLPTRVAAATLAAGTGGTGGTSPTLPLLRWSSAVATLHAHEGVGSTAAGNGPVLASVAGLAFGVAGGIWQVLGTVVNAAQGGGAGGVAAPLDAVYHRLGASFATGAGLTSLTVVVVLGGVGLAGWSAYRAGRGIGGALRGLAGVLLPVAILVVSVGAAARSGTAAGSPGWVVRAVSGWTTGIASGFSRLADQVIPVPSGVGSDPPGQIGCAGYVDGLEDQYLASRAGGSGAPASLRSSTALALSHAWEGSVLAPWIQAQFGGSALAERSWCHLLEVQAGVPASDQLTAMAADHPGAPLSATSGPTWSDLVDGRHPSAATLLGPQYAGGDDDLDRVMVGWAACDYVGPGQGDDGWRVDPAFASVGDPPPSDAAHTCSTWWDNGTTEPPPQGAGAGPFDFEDEGALVSATAHGSTTARSYIAALEGQGGGSRAIGPSLIALASSVAYAWSLGGPALGVLVGQLALVLLVAMLPAVLLLAAVPTPTTRRLAGRAGRLTVAALLSSAGFTLLLSVLLGLIGVLGAVANGLLGPGAGAIPGLAQVLVPVAAVVVLRRVLRPLGMDAAVSLVGSLRTAVDLGRRGVSPAPDHPPPRLASATAARTLRRSAHEADSLLDPAPRLPRPIGAAGPLALPRAGAPPASSAPPPASPSLAASSPPPTWRASVPAGAEPVVRPSTHAVASSTGTTRLTDHQDRRPSRPLLLPPALPAAADRSAAPDQRDGGGGPVDDGAVPVAAHTDLPAADAASSDSPAAGSPVAVDGAGEAEP